jgi:hypothetical protein
MVKEPSRPPKTTTHRRSSARSLPRQKEQKPAPQPQLQARKRILDHLHDLIGSCEELFAEHGEDCACETCCVVSNLVGSLRVFHMLLEIS